MKSLHLLLCWIIHFGAISVLLSAGVAAIYLDWIALTDCSSTYLDCSKEASEKGRQAYKLGLPASANPFHRNDFISESWLNGYIEEMKCSKGIQ